MRSRRFRERVLIVGTSELAVRIVDEVEAHPGFRWDIVGLVQDGPVPERFATAYPLLGPLTQLGKLIKRDGAAPGDPHPRRAPRPAPRRGPRRGAAPRRDHRGRSRDLRAAHGQARHRDLAALDDRLRPGRGPLPARPRPRPRREPPGVGGRPGPHRAPARPDRPRDQARLAGPGLLPPRAHRPPGPPVPAPEVPDDAAGRRAPVGVGARQRGPHHARRRLAPPVPPGRAAPVLEHPPRRDEPRRPASSSGHER